jgi:hypothetical protein
VAEENQKKGIFVVNENQRRFPGVLVNKLLSKYKQPKSVDTGPENEMK